MTVKDSTVPQQVVSSSFQITIGTQLVISTQSPLPQGIVNTAYTTTTMAAAGGATPYTWSATNLPAGLTISSAGVISGTPLVAAIGTTIVAITVKDSGTTQQSATGNFSITIAGVLQITTPSPLPQGFVGIAYNQTVLATGGITNYTWSATGLPTGLSINASTGAITGTPTGPVGTTTATISVKDSGNPQQSVSAPLSITISSPLAITTTSPLPLGFLNTPYSVTMVATGGTTTYSWTATGLPAGLTINPSTGVISGTPTGPVGPSSATITVKDSSTPQQSASGSFSITIIQQFSIITGSPLPLGIVGTAYNTTVTATGGTTPYVNWSATGLPSGLTINPGTGVISGTPTGSASTNSVVITVKDSTPQQQTASATLVLTVILPLTITPTTKLPDGQVNVAYTAQVTPSGGTPSYTWSASGLPTGLTIDPGTGVISGTVSTPFSGNITVTVKDSSNPQQSATATLSLVITGPLTITTSLLPNGFVGTAYSTPLAGAGGISPYFWSATGLPAGLTMSSGGVISGTPTGPAGPSSVTITLKDSSVPQKSTPATLTLTIVSQLVFTTTSPLPSGNLGQAYLTTVAATGGTPGYSWSATGLPGGLTINPSTGVISGTPIASGTFSSVAITVKDSSTPQQSTTATFTLVIRPQLLGITTTSPLTQGQEGYLYPGVSMQATGGTLPYSWSAPNCPDTNPCSGLPLGLTMSSFGVINGTPAPGTSNNNTAYLVPVTVTDSSNPVMMASTTLSLTIVIGSFLSFPSKEQQPQGTTVGMNLEIPILINLSVPATGLPCNVSAQTGNGCIIVSTNSPGIVLVSSVAGGAGSTKIAIPTSSGASSVFFYAYGAASSGSATLTATLFNYTSATIPISTGLSGFVLAGPNGNGASFITGQGQQTTLTAMSMLLDSSMNPLATQAVAGGINPVVTFTLGNSSIGTLSPTSLTFTGGNSSLTTKFTAGTNVLSSTITANEPTGFATPAGNLNVLPVSVASVLLSCTAVTVGFNLEAQVTCSLNSAAASKLTVTLTSNSSSLTFSTDGVSAGASSITRSISAGSSSTPPFYVYGVGSSGPATYSATAVNSLQTVIAGTTGTVTLAPSGFILHGAGGLGNPFTTTAGGPPVSVNVEAALLDSSGNYVNSPMPMAGGVSANVIVTSGSTSVGTISGSPAVVSNASGGQASVNFQGLATGSSTLTAVQPTGYMTPLQFATVEADVSLPKLFITNLSTTVGNGLETQGTILLLGSSAPAGGLQVTFTVTGASPIALSRTGIDAGSGQVTITIAQGLNYANFYVYGQSTSGTGTFTVTAPNFQSTGATETLTSPSVVISGPSGFGVNSIFCCSPQTLYVQTGIFDGSGNFGAQQVAGTNPLTVILGDDATTVGTISPQTAVIPAGPSGGTANITFTPANTGTADITAFEPSGYATPPNGQNVVNMFVN